MIKHLQELLEKALEDLKRNGEFPKDLSPEIIFERTKSKEHGDFATNLALTLAKPLKKSPRDIAQLLTDNLIESLHVSKVEVAGPGFINFFLTENCRRQVIKQIIKQGDEFGDNAYGKNKKITVEFVSANPTGPLHVGHGRGAAYGASLSNILEKCGYNVQREYYVNDNGRQMDILATSVWLRYVELCGQPVVFPDNGYQGDYIVDIARIVRKKYG
ncbi:MAG TPA: arginine--tRNA ligase, partial [Gammaproteobacteria bacterium]|nr:arginine--tRNA ligase [Gammaproteobacteria bacterium]